MRIRRGAKYWSRGKLKSSHGQSLTSRSKSPGELDQIYGFSVRREDWLPTWLCQPMHAIASWQWVVQGFMEYSGYLRFSKSWRDKDRRCLICV